MSAEEDINVDEIPEDQLAPLLLVEKTALDKIITSKQKRDIKYNNAKIVIERDYSQYKEKNEENIIKYNKLIEQKSKDKTLVYNTNESAIVANVTKKIKEVDQSYLELKAAYDKDIENLNLKFQEQERKNIQNRHLRYRKEIEAIEKKKEKDQEAKEEEDRLLIQAQREERHKREAEERKRKEKEDKVNQLRKRKKERLAKRTKELDALSRQFVALTELVDSTEEGLNDITKTPYEKEVIHRKLEKLHVVRHITQHRKERREKITLGDRLETDIESDTELSDGGFSTLESEGDYHQSTFPTQTKQIERRAKRFRKPKKPKKPKAPRKGDTSDEDTSDSSTDEHGMARVKLNLGDLPKFTGEDPKKFPSLHLVEFEDCLDSVGLGWRGMNDKDEAEQIVVKFKNSLKGNARRWYKSFYNDETNMDIAKWKDVKTEFLKTFSPTGGTKEEQHKAWKDLKWDPDKDSIDNFTYKFNELGDELEKSETERFNSFRSCMPSTTYLMTSECKTINEIVLKLKTCLAFGYQVLNLIQAQIQPPQHQSCHLWP